MNERAKLPPKLIRDLFLVLWAEDMETVRRLIDAMGYPEGGSRVRPGALSLSREEWSADKDG